MKSEAKTVNEYLENLPEDRKLAISNVREVILDNLPKGYAEVMNWGMITYEIPLKIKPETYNGQPLMYAALASQKNHMAVYLSGVYADEKLLNWFRSEWKKSGKKLNMGKSCVRFKKLDDLNLDVIGKTIEWFSVSEFIKIYEDSRKK